MGIGIIKTKRQHAEAIAQLENLMVAEPDPGSTDERMMELLAHLIDEYESKTFRSEPVTHAELLEFLMDLHDLSQSDLAPLVGGKSRVSEVVKGLRPLSVRAMSLLKAAFHLEWETVMTCRAPGTESVQVYDSAELTAKGAQLATKATKALASATSKRSRATRSKARKGSSVSSGKGKIK